MSSLAGIARIMAPVGVPAVTMKIMMLLIADYKCVI